MGARGAPLAELWSWTPTGGWAMMPLTGTVPTQSLAATYSPHDWRLWIVDETANGKLLLRVNPMTATVVSTGDLAVLENLTSISLTTLEDGRVLLAGNTPDESYRLAVLEATPHADDSEVVVTALHEEAGTLGMTPAVRRGMITFGLEQLEDDRTKLAVQQIAVAALPAP